MNNISLPLAERQELIRFTRFLFSTGQGEVIGKDNANADTIIVLRSDGVKKAFPRPCLKHAISIGLIGIDGTQLKCLAVAKTFLKRALGPDEDEIWRGQHADLRPIMKGSSAQTTTTVRLNLDESPLASLARLKDKSGEPFLPAEAFDAGHRLHADFMRAQLQPRITQSFSPRIDIGHKGNTTDLSDTAIAARIRFNKAVTAMGPDLQGVAVDVCCFAKGLEMVEHERGWPQRSAKLMLRTALMALHRHYNPPMPVRRSETQHWGDDGFRPELKR